MVIQILKILILFRMFGFRYSGLTCRLYKKLSQIIFALTHPSYNKKRFWSMVAGLDKKTGIYYNARVIEKTPFCRFWRRLRISGLGVWNFLRWVLRLRREHTSGNSKNWAQNQFDSRSRDFYFSATLCNSSRVVIPWATLISPS